MGGVIIFMTGDNIWVWDGKEMANMSKSKPKPKPRPKPRPGY